eukprot:CAMPEP_0170484104 /NCGR_PEP_ID=MMETSP0208-20121228/3647_1 /TAXON_ID=197538 /ORGANISM="Strombidium inclinatum, Strain S3" /LENGTH=75 /DNA_ID=CAMNT_0010757363 /DNA_START=602 /DNA_END=829 /DNA_ORIENTATION=-
MTSFVHELEEGKDVKYTDAAVVSGVRAYFKMGFPTLLVIVADWSCFEVMILMSGYMSVNEQATLVILMNVVALVF